MSVCTIFKNDFNIIKKNGGVISFNKNLENQYNIFDYLECSIRLDDSVFIHTTSLDMTKWDALLTLPNNPSAEQQDMISMILKEQEHFNNFTTKGYASSFYSFKDKELHFDDFDYPQLDLFFPFKFLDFSFFIIFDDLTKEQILSPLMLQFKEVINILQNEKFSNCIVGNLDIQTGQFVLWVPLFLSFFQRCMLFNSILPDEARISKLNIYTLKPFQVLEEIEDPNIYSEINFQTNPDLVYALRKKLT